MDFLQVDQKLVTAILDGTSAGFMMSGLEPAPVGVSKLAPHAQEIAVLIGLAGKRSGTATMLLSRRAAIYLALRFLGSEHDEAEAEMRNSSLELSQIREDVFDAISEITNIIAGTVKERLAEYGVTTISCPSIIFGADYNMYHFKGFVTASVEYEIREIPQFFFMDRYMGVTISLSQS
jgi:CheY-specific phosphatase CheX